MRLSPHPAQARTASLWWGGHSEGLGGARLERVPSGDEVLAVEVWVDIRSQGEVTNHMLAGYGGEVSVLAAEDPTAGADLTPVPPGD
ncbi:MAG: hypothetical protein IKG11_00215 [Atopobiaceae bacterium]|nr:hypothetical protein [Atopobiaceae bacterium]